MDHITDHAARMVGRLAAQFKDRPNLLQVIDNHGARYQGLEDALWSLTAGRSLEDAVGAQLDLQGRILAFRRPLMGLASTDDKAYRGVLEARVQSLASDGEPERLLSILALLGSERTQLIELATAFPGMVVVRLAFKGTLDCLSPDAMLLLVPGSEAGVRIILSGNEDWWPDRHWGADDVWPTYVYTDGLWGSDGLWGQTARWGGDMEQ